MTLESIKLIDQISFWAVFIIGGAAIAVILIYEIFPRQKKS